MSALPWREHPAAREEYLDALAWYDDQEAGLGNRLGDDLDNAVDFIREWPDSGPLYRGRQRIPRLRRKGTDVFPYGIIYFVRDDEVIVVAYAHERRRPGYWRRRLKDL
ncbi:type II toxin-antitoxin system RelE/ParE family toxin [Microbacterium istanbulense]|uniref:Type II toxin-antitoxin system RelE/ParE family toxin n=1 Tax=Microbacterium istanbulense TaxID=3122049 RepID=A0ABU8LNJ7_9MICO|nr:type II toxin-antitoxin system RelE/ParE family toxin [Cryobacterium sp.]